MQLTSLKDAQAPTSTQTLYIFHAATSSAQVSWPCIFSSKTCGVRFSAPGPRRRSISSVPLSIGHICKKKKTEVLDQTVDLEISVADIMQVVSQIHLQVLISLPRQPRLLRMNSSSTSPTELLIHSRLLANDVDINAHLQNVQATLSHSMNTQEGMLSEANTAGAPIVPAH